MSAVVINKDNFQEEVIKSTVPVLLDFWAPWCGPCQELLPIVEALADEVGGKAKICKINVDENKELARQFRIMSVPSIMVFSNGQMLASSAGVKSKKELMDMLEL
ncbi:MAG: thioredoxin [Filifactoraceae bacterium]